MMAFLPVPPTMWLLPEPPWKLSLPEPMATSTSEGKPIPRLHDTPRPDAKDPNRPSNALHIPFTDVIEGQVQLVAHLVADLARHAEPARLRKAPRRAATFTQSP
jgi:hypothetical protein